MRTPMLICAVVVVSGCASKPETPPPTAAYAGKPLAVFIHAAPDFAAITWSRTMMNGAVEAGLDSVAEGNSLVAEFEVPDPSPSIAAELGASLSASLKVAPRAAVRTGVLDVKPGGDGLVLDVATESWMFTYVPTDAAHYQVKYMGHARLYDAATGGDLADVPCRWESYDKDAPSYDELLAGRAALLKDMLAAAAKDCAASYEKAFLAAPALQQPPAQ